MSREPVIWGVHMGEHVGSAPVENGYVAIGWQELGDLRGLPADRETFKATLRNAYPDKPEAAIRVEAGVLFRFIHEMQAGDVVVYPSKHNRMINIGRFSGKSTYLAGDADEYPNHRAVEWLGHFPRSDFSQSALNELGAFLALFKVSKHADEVLAKVGLASSTAQPLITTEQADEPATDDLATQAVSQQAEITTGDFVVRRIMAGLTGYEFEEFVAHLLQCLGYTARVTPKSGDGGVDVIAHMDALGLQPPIVKVQCKRMTSQIGNAEVNQLLGTLGEGEFGLFVTLGNFSRAALELERNRSKLRLIDGEQFVEIVLANYSKLSPRYRTLIPLKQIYVPDLPKT